MSSPGLTPGIDTVTSGTSVDASAGGPFTFTIILDNVIEPFFPINGSIYIESQADQTHNWMFCRIVSWDGVDQLQVTKIANSASATSDDSWYLTVIDGAPINTSVLGTSSTSITLPIDTNNTRVTLVTNGGKAFVTGSIVRIAKANDDGIWFLLVITDYDIGTGDLAGYLYNSTSVGSGTYSSWGIQEISPFSNGTPYKIGAVQNYYGPFYNPYFIELNLTDTSSYKLKITADVDGGAADRALVFRNITGDYIITYSGNTTLSGMWVGPTSVSQGDLLYGSASNVWSALTKNTSATRYLSNTGASNSPAWAQIALTTGVSGTLPIANGGSGQTTATEAFDALAPTTTAGDIIYSNGTDNVRLAVGTANQILRTNSAANAPNWTNGFLTVASGSFPAAATLQVTIPAGYSDIQISISGASSNTASRILQIQLNADTTAGNYAGTTIDGTGAAVTTINTANLLSRAAAATAAQTLSGDAVISGYATAGNKLFTAAFVDGPLSVRSVIGRYLSTAAIVTIDFSWNGSGNFDAGTYIISVK